MTVASKTKGGDVVDRSINFSNSGQTRIERFRRSDLRVHDWEQATEKQLIFFQQRVQQKRWQRKKAGKTAGKIAGRTAGKTAGKTEGKIGGKIAERTVAVEKRQVEEIEFYM